VNSNLNIIKSQAKAHRPNTRKLFKKKKDSVQKLETESI